MNTTTVETCQDCRKPIWPEGVATTDFLDYLGELGTAYRGICTCGDLCLRCGKHYGNMYDPPEPGDCECKFGPQREPEDDQGDDDNPLRGLLEPAFLERFAQGLLETESLKSALNVERYVKVLKERKEEGEGEPYVTPNVKGAARSSSCQQPPQDSCENRGQGNAHPDSTPDQTVPRHGQLLSAETRGILQDAGTDPALIRFLDKMSGMANALNNSRNPVAALNTMMTREGAKLPALFAKFKGSRQ